jgi:hypothetical protein
MNRRDPIRVSFRPIPAVGAIAVAVLFFTTLAVLAAQQPAHAVYAIVQYDISTDYGGQEEGYPAVVRTRDYVQRQADGTGWLVRSVLLDGWEKGNNPQTSGCGYPLQQVDVDRVQISGIANNDVEHFLYDSGYRHLDDANGCQVNIETFNGATELQVNYDRLRIRTWATVRLTGQTDSSGQIHRRWMDITSPFGHIRGCVYPEGHKYQCNEDAT